MFARLLASFQSAEDRRLKLGLLAVVLLQIVAMWLLCSHQVRKAEARQTEVRIERMALADCLRYVPGATIATCNSRLPIALKDEPRARDDSALATDFMTGNSLAPGPTSVRVRPVSFTRTP